MARLNIEEKFWKDDRFLALVEKLGKFRAVGAFICAMKAAQNFWVQDKLIPRQAWDVQDFPPALFAVGLAEDLPGGKTLEDGTQMAPGIYVRGSESQFAWLRAKRKNGSKGGLAKARAAKRGLSKENSNLSLAKEKFLDAGSDEVAERVTTTDAKRNVVSDSANENGDLFSAASSDSLATASLSSPFSKYKEELQIQRQIQCSNGKRLSVCRFDLEAAYAEYPRKQGKSAGLKRLAREIKTEVDYWDLLTAIRNYNKSEDVKRGYVKHFSTFTSEWRDWVDSETGTVRKLRSTKHELTLAEVESIEKTKQANPPGEPL